MKRDENKIIAIPNARATEDRRTNTIVDAVAEIVGRDQAERMMDEIETYDDAPAPEGPAAKLTRMRECATGRQWLEQHPKATWDDIAQARV